MLKMDPINISCLLCKTETMLSIGIFGAEGITLNIADIIHNHFGIEVMLDGGDESSRICFKCWSTTDCFHNLYELVHNSERQLSKHASSVTKPADPVQPTLDLPQFETVKTEFIDAEFADVADAPMAEADALAIDALAEADALTIDALAEADAADDALADGDNDDRMMSDDELADHGDQSDREEATATRSRTRSGNPSWNESQLIRKTCSMKCDLCAKKFGTLTDALLHYRQEHNRTGYIKCCGTRYFRRSSLLGHVKSHTKRGRDSSTAHGTTSKIARVENENDDAHQAFDALADGDDEQADNEVRKSCDMKCELCPKKFATFSDAQSHYLQEHKRTGYIKCCAKRYFRHDELLEHEKSHSSKMPDCDAARAESADYSMAINDDSQAFEAATATRLHARSVNEIQLIRQTCTMECELCPQKFGTLQEAQLHYRQEHKRTGYIKCCGTRYFRPCRLLGHVKSHRKSDDGGALGESADYSVDNDDSQMSDALAEDDDNRSDRVETETAANDKIGGQEYRNNQLIRRTCNMKCELCPKMLGTLKEAQMHYRRAHKRTGYIQCCGKRYFRGCRLLAHVKSHRETQRFRCDQCDQTFRSSEMWRIHRLRHLSAKKSTAEGGAEDDNAAVALIRQFFNMSCDLCETTFETMKEALIHYREVHKRTGYLKCCEKRFFRRCYAMEHIKVHQMPDTFRCDPCRRPFANAEALRLHCKSHKVHKCNSCTAEFMAMSQLTNHQRIKHWKDGHRQYGCDKCGLIFKCKSSMSVHMLEAHNLGSEEATSSGAPEDPETSLANTNTLDESIEIKEETIETYDYDEAVQPTMIKVSDQSTYDGAEGKLSKDSEYLEEVLLLRKYFNMRCELCSKAFTTMKDTLAHYRRVHRRPGYIKCCGKKFFRRCYALEHINLHRNPDYFRCDPCGKSLPSYDSLRIHNRIHHGGNYDDEFKCDLCSESFPTNIGLRLHVSKAHNQLSTESSVLCDLCLEKFASAQLLSNHKRLMHKIADGARPFGCDICGKSYAQKFWLELHLRSAHLPEGSEQPVGRQHASADEVRRQNRQIRKYFDMNCELCSAKFVTMSQSLRHYQNVHQKNGYLRCCGKKFFRRCYAMEHTNVHLEPNFYSCSLCEKTFLSREPWRLHNKTHHSGLEAESNAVNNDGSTTLHEHRSSSSVKAGDKNDGGNDRNERLERDRARARLMFTALRTPNRFGCDICGKWYASKDQIGRHLRRVHRPKILLEEALNKSNGRKSAL